MIKNSFNGEYSLAVCLLNKLNRLIKSDSQDQGLSLRIANGADPFISAEAEKRQSLSCNSVMNIKK